MIDFQILRWVLIALAIVLIAFLVRHTVRRARALDECIDEYHESQENETGARPNPYESMAGLFGADDEEERKTSS